MENTFLDLALSKKIVEKLFCENKNQLTLLN